MWIVDTALAGPTGEPTAPYAGDQFVNFKVSPGGRALEVLDMNNDGKAYQYALAFSVPTVVGEAKGSGGRLAMSDAPSVSGDKRSVTFLDEESSESAYQYAVALDGPGGRIILDPKVTNGGGVPPLLEPEPVPQ